MSRLKRRDDPRLDLRDRTVGEDLWVWRVSQPDPVGRSWPRHTMPRDVAARLIGVSLRAYVGVENGSEVRQDRLTALRTMAISSVVQALGRDYGAVVEANCLREFRQVVNGVRPTAGVLCRLARRRSGAHVAEVMRDLGVTRQTLWNWEMTGGPRLVAYWCGRGFVFSDEDFALQNTQEAI